MLSKQHKLKYVRSLTWVDVSTTSANILLTAVNDSFILAAYILDKSVTNESLLKKNGVHILHVPSNSTVICMQNTSQKYYLEIIIDQDKDFGEKLKDFGKDKQNVGPSSPRRFDQWRLNSRTYYMTSPNF